MSEPRKIGLISNGFTAPADSLKKNEQSARTQRFNLTLVESTDDSCPEFSYTDLCKNIACTKDNAVANIDPSAALGLGNGSEDDSVLLLAQKYEAKYAPKPRKRKREDRVKDLVDLGDGYDDTDSFVDNSEAYDEYMPCSMSTKYGGFYINFGQLDLVPENDESVDEIPFRKKHKKSKQLVDLEDSSQTPADSDINVKRKRIKDGSSVLGEKRRKSKFGNAVKKVDKSLTVADILNIVSNPVPSGSYQSTDPRFSIAAHIQTAEPMTAQILKMEEEPIDCSLHPASSSVHSVAPGAPLSESRPEVSTVTNALSTVDSAIEAVVLRARRDEECRDVSLKPDDQPMTPDCLSNELLDTLTMISKLAKQSEDHRITLFTPEVNQLLLKIGASTRNIESSLRLSVLDHASTLFACGSQGLQKQMRKLNAIEDNNEYNIQNPNEKNDKLKRFIADLKELIDCVMPSMMEKYREGLSATEKLKQDRMIDLKEQRDGKPEEESEEEEDNRGGEGGGSAAEKQKRITNPRRKFEWTTASRVCLCRIVEIKMQQYQMSSKSQRQSAEEYLKAFFEAEIKPLWEPGWIHTRVLFRESRSAHDSCTGFGALKPKKQNVFSSKTSVQTSAGVVSEKVHVSENYSQATDLSMSATPSQTQSLLTLDEQMSCRKPTVLRSGDSSELAFVSAVPLSTVQDVLPTTPVGITSNSLISTPQSLDILSTESTKPSTKLNIPDNLGASRSTQHDVVNIERNGSNSIDVKPSTSAEITQKYFPNAHVSQSSPVVYDPVERKKSHKSSHGVRKRERTNILPTIPPMMDLTPENMANLAMFSQYFAPLVGAANAEYMNQFRWEEVVKCLTGLNQAPPRSAYTGSDSSVGLGGMHSQSRVLTKEDRKSRRAHSRAGSSSSSINSSAGVSTDRRNSSSTPTLLERRFESSQRSNLLPGVLKERTERSGSSATPKSLERMRFESGIESKLLTGVSSVDRRGSFTTPKSPEKMRFNGIESNFLSGISIQRRGSFATPKSPEKMKFESSIESNISSGISMDTRTSFMAPKSPERIRFESGVQSNMSLGVTTERRAGFATPSSPEGLRFDLGSISVPTSNRSASLNQVAGLSVSHSSTTTSGSYLISGTTNEMISQDNSVDRFAGWRKLYSEKSLVSSSNAVKVSDNANSTAINKSDLNAAIYAKAANRVRNNHKSTASGATFPVTTSSILACERLDSTPHHSSTLNGQDIVNLAIRAVSQQYTGSSALPEQVNVISHTSKIQHNINLGSQASGEPHGSLASNVGSEVQRNASATAHHTSETQQIASVASTTSYTAAVKQLHHVTSPTRPSSAYTVVQQSPQGIVSQAVTSQVSTVRQSQYIGSLSGASRTLDLPIVSRLPSLSSVGRAAPALKQPQHGTSTTGQAQVGSRSIASINLTSSSSTFLPYQSGSSVKVAPSCATSSATTSSTNVTKNYTQSTTRPSNPVSTHSSSSLHHHAQVFEDLCVYILNITDFLS